MLENNSMSTSVQSTTIYSLVSRILHNQVDAAGHIYR